MRILTVSQQAIVDAAAKGPVLWLFEIGAHRWSSQAVTWSGSGYDFRILPKSFSGVTERRCKPEQGVVGSTEASFDIVGTGLLAADFIDQELMIRLVIQGEEVGVWRMIIKQCDPQDGLLKFRCVDFLSTYLDGDFPVGVSIASAFPGNNAYPDACPPVVAGEDYAQLHLVRAASGEAGYLLGSSDLLYTVPEVRAPLDETPATYLATDYVFNQVTVTQNGASWKLLQPLIFKGGNIGYWKSGNTTFKPIIARASSSIYKDTTNPADFIAGFFSEIGINPGAIDSAGSFAAAKSEYAARSIDLAGTFGNLQTRKKALCSILVQCHSIIRISDKIELHPNNTGSVKTVTASSVIKNTFKRTSITRKTSDSGEVQWVEGLESRSTLVSAGTATDSPESGTLDCWLTHSSNNAQWVARAYYQRKLGALATASWAGKANLLTLQPGDVVTVAGTRYGNPVVMVDDVTLKRDLQVKFKATEYSPVLEPWGDYAPVAVAAAVDPVPDITDSIVTNAKCFYLLQGEGADVWMSWTYPSYTPAKHSGFKIFWRQQPHRWAWLTTGITTISQTIPPATDVGSTAKAEADASWLSMREKWEETGTSHFLAEFTDGINYEVVKYDLATGQIERGVEGTIAREWPVGTEISYLPSDVASDDEHLVGAEPRSTAPGNVSAGFTVHVAICAYQETNDPTGYQRTNLAVFTAEEVE